VLPRAAGLGDELLEAGVEAGVAVAKQHDVLIWPLPGHRFQETTKHGRPRVYHFVSFDDLHLLL
jgi:hypothetical protein